MSDRADLTPDHDENADDVRAALHEVASWYGPDEPAIDVGVGVVDHPTTTGWSRSILVAAVVAAVLGWIGLAVAGRGSGGVTDRAASTVATAPDPATVGPDDPRVLELCLDVDTELDVDRLATTGDIHRFVPPTTSPTTSPASPATSEIDVIVADGNLHVTCTLGRRDTGWFQVFAIVGVHVPGPAADEVQVDQMIDFGGRLALSGRRGDEIDSITVKVGDDIHTATSSGEWWLATFPDTDDEQQFPDHTVRWTYRGTASEATADELQAASAWTLCARDDECRTARIAELTELAAALDDPGQAALLADGEVTEEERAAATRAWGTCIGDETRSSVDFDPDGTFYIHGDGVTDEVWDRCYRLHAEYALAVADLIDVAG